MAVQRSSDPTLDEDGDARFILPSRAMRAARTAPRSTHSCGRSATGRGFATCFAEPGGQQCRRRLASPSAISGRFAGAPEAQLSTDRRFAAAHVGPLGLKTLILAQPKIHDKRLLRRVGRQDMLRRGEQLAHPF